MSATSTPHRTPLLPHAGRHGRRLSVASAAGTVSVHRVGRADMRTLAALCEEHARRCDPERTAFGPTRGETLELEEALFDLPTRAWAWIARVDGAAIGYAGASAGCSLLERANYFRIESLYVQAAAPVPEVERRLFQQVLRTARMLGCLNLQWQLPFDQVGRLRAQLPPALVPTATAHYVLPLESASTQRPADGG